MCFSASASFGAGAALTVLGVLSLRKSESRSHIMFASIPLLFAAQQFTEGFVWLSFINSQFAGFNILGTYIFMAFAQIVWPAWVPWSIYLLETNPRRKKLLFVFTAIGIIVSAYLAYCLIAYPISSRVASHHISYDLQYPMGIISKGVSLYFLAIIFTPFFSTIKRMWLVGLLTLSAMLLAKLYFHEYVISVWCFFAAVISFVVLYMIPILNQHIKTYRNA